MHKFMVIRERDGGYSIESVHESIKDAERALKAVHDADQCYMVYVTFFLKGGENDNAE